MVTLTDTLAETINLSQTNSDPPRAWFLSDQVNVTPATSYVYQPGGLVQDQFNIIPTQAVSLTWHPVISDTIRMSVAFLKLYDSVVLSETVNISETLSFFKYAYDVLTEGVDITDTLTQAFEYAASLAELIYQKDRLVVSHGPLISETLNISEALALYRGAMVIEALGISSQLVSSFLFQKSVADQLTLADQLAKYFGVSISDVLALVESLSNKLIVSKQINETAQLTDVADRVLLIQATAADTVEITPDQAIQMLLGVVVDENVEIVSTYLEPSGSVTTWAINIAHGATTEYTNFNFNSFAQVGNICIAANDSGLYELTGNTDVGTDIISRIRSGIMSFGGGKLSSIKGAYIGARGGGDWVLKIITDEQKTYIYSVHSSTMKTTKVHVGKGIRARYFAYELLNTGQDFDLESIEFLPIVAQRRV